MERPFFPDNGTDTSGGAKFADESGDDGRRGEEGDWSIVYVEITKIVIYIISIMLDYNESSSNIDIL